MVFIIRTAPQPQQQVPATQQYRVNEYGEVVTIEPEEKENPFAEPVNRNKFIRKVYMWLMLFMAITAGTIAFFVSDVFTYEDAWLNIPIGWTIYVVCAFAFLCIGDIKHKSPWNIILSLVASFGCGMAIGSLCKFYAFEDVIAAGLTTFLIVTVVTLLTFCTRFDMTKWTGMISIATLAFLITWIWFPFFPSEALYFAMMGLAVAIMTLFMMYSMLNCKTHDLV